MSQFHIVFTLLGLFQLKHLIADYPLQTPYMLKKFEAGWSFFFPLLTHALVHAYFTYAIALYFADAKTAMICFYLDLFIHFVMDRFKAGPKYLGRFKDMYDRKFWWSLGLDQMVHHYTHYLIIYILIKAIK